MATTPATKTTAAPKTPREPVPMHKRIDSQVTKAVLADKMTHTDLKTLVDRLTKLHAFVAQE